jgi:hypothetical protein
MATLVVPGVRVEVQFDVLPPLPAPAGILGAVGIVDRMPADNGLVAVTKISEVRDLLGPGTQASMPEVVHALFNGISEVVISPVKNGKPAKLELFNADTKGAVLLRVRSNGSWGNQLRCEVREIADAVGKVVRVSIRLLYKGHIVESFDDLQVSPSQPDDLFDAINQRSRYVVALDPGFADATPKKGTYPFAAEGTPIKIEEDKPNNPRSLFEISPAGGASPAGLSVKLDVSDTKKVSVQVFQAGLQEQFDDLTMDPDSDRYLPYVLLTQSTLIRVRSFSSLEEGKRLPKGTDAPLPFSEGVSPTTQDYLDAIDRLSDDPRIDLVLASIEPTRSIADVHTIHKALVAHAVAMTDNAAPRIAFGSVTPDEQKDLGKVRDHAAAVRNRRFVLVAPSGAEGAVAGMIGRMNPKESPTFKNVPLIGLNPASYREAELNKLLGPTINALVVQNRVGRGVIVLRGLDTTGDQISVTRVADICIRETKAIAENFIGQLNTEDARITLKQMLVSTFTRMEREGALVRSTDGKDPAFYVDVYSTQMDFAQGIVRIDIAVRPVRAIDYIYATIRVKN